MPCFLSLFHNPYKGHSLLRPSFTNRWEGIASVFSGHSVVAKPLNPKGWTGPGHSLSHVVGHRRPRLAVLPAVPHEGPEGTGCHHARQGTGGC